MSISRSIIFDYVSVLSISTAQAQMTRTMAPSSLRTGWPWVWKPVREIWVAQRLQISQLLVPAALILCSLSYGSQCWGQITDLTDTTSVPIPGVGHDYIEMLSETVGPASGSVSFRINVPVPPGRHLTLPFSFAYDTNGVHFPHVPAGVQPQWSSNQGFLGQGGWSYSAPLLGGVSIAYPASPPSSGTCYDMTNYMFQDSAGMRHSFPRLREAAGAPRCDNPVLSDYDDMFQVSLPSAGNGLTPYPATVADAEGTAFIFSSSNPCHQHSSTPINTWPCISLPSSIEDRNGNQLTIKDLNTAGGAFTVTDTLGRTELSSSGFGNTGNTVTASGLGGAYTVTWGTANSNFTTSWVQVIPDPDNYFCFPPTQDTETQPVITAISLPNGKQYTFSYDATYGEISRITYPSGGYISYQWSLNQQSASFSFPDTGYGKPGDTNAHACLYHYDTPALVHRYVSFDGVTTALQQDFSYSTTWDTTNVMGWDSKTTTVTTHDFVRGTVFQTVYAYSPLYPATAYTFSSQIPLEQTITYQDTNGAKLRTVSKTWLDQYILGSKQVTMDNGVSSQEVYKYSSATKSCPSDPSCQLTEKDEYDFGQSTPSRKTVIGYQSFANTPIYTAGPSIFDRPSAIITYDGTGNRIAETDYSYDQTAVTSVSPLPTGHDETNYSASYNNRGNATSKTARCFPLPPATQTCSDALTTYSYDETGQVASMINPNRNATLYSHADSFTSGTPPGNTNAYLTKITRPQTNGISHIRSVSYSYADGQLTQTTDENNQITTYKYNDPLDRLTEIDDPDTGETTYSYNDAAPSPSVTRTELIAGSIGSPTSTTLGMTAVMDGLGHRVQTQLTTDPDGTTYTAARYDGLGRNYQVWNPTRCSPPTTNCGETTWGVTTSIYDAIGRITKVTKPDGSAVTTSYTGNQTTVADEVGNQRTSQTDALGRLTTVFEAPNNSSFNYETDYTYNALDDLLSVTQKGSSTSSSNWRVRNFQYDSLSRLTSASNPESGTISYTYDANSNLTTKVAPKPGVATGTAVVTTNYAYDALNRLIKKSYVNISTAAVQFGYDGTGLTGCGVQPPTISSPTNLVGRRSSMCSGSSGSSWSYDPMGRPLLESRRNAGYTKNISYQYWLDGSLNQLTYPSGDIVSYTPGGAGRVTGVADTPGNSFVYTVTYAPQGAVASMIQAYRITNVLTNSIGISTTNIYNNRLQPILLSASVSVTSGGVTTNTPVFGLCYDFHLGVAVNSPPCSFSSYTSGDNGNVFQVVNNLDSTRSTTFAYDPLNRISQANTTTTTGSNCWGEIYTIDAWSNLTNRTGVPSMTGCSVEGLNAPANANNQLTGISYDIAGNVINDGNGNQPTYDAENRVITDAGVTYSYDADGLRIKKSSGTMHWLGPGGETLAETDLSGNINEEYVYFNGQRIARVDRPSGTVHYYFSDHLRSASVITDINGNVQEQYFYYPFGGLVSSIGSDPNHYKFTGKERDTESNLDEFGARYYSSAYGRFMTPDWAARPAAVPYAVFGDPQSLNLYGYVRNDPISVADADGHGAACDSGDSKNACNAHEPGDVKQEQTAQAQNQGSGGFFQKLGNWLNGNGWKTNDQVISDERQWLSDNKIVGRNAEGKEVPTDWSKASVRDVTSAYAYVHDVMAAANANHVLSVIGVAATVSFGHGARHLAGTGLNQADVEAAIQEDVQTGVKNATQPTGNFWGRVNVGGQTIEYRAYTLPNGTINVGTYYIP